MQKVGVIGWVAMLATILLVGCGRSGIPFARIAVEADTSNGDDDDGDDDFRPECEVATQCEQSTDPCTTVSCEQGRCVTAPRDADGDGAAPPECGGDDCNDLNPNANQTALEDCFDGDDNDCNGVSDCFDPACADVPNCGCTPNPSGESCDNGQDDDCDTTVDCNDTDCIGTPACGCASNELGVCGNGFDDDCDMLIDCNDSDCIDDEVCLCANRVEDCSNGSDDDCDLLVDCGDPDCDGLFPCTCSGTPSPERCDDGLDNDCNDLVDCADPACFLAPACEACEPEICDNGRDDDCNNQIDCADPACAFDPLCAPVPELCNNSLDDDNDGSIDCDDPDCVGVPTCQSSQNVCQAAALIPGSGTYTGNTVGNSNNHEGTCGGGAGEAIFRFVLNEPSRVRLDSIGSDFDTVIYVRTGSCQLGAELRCDDDSGGQANAARLEFTLLYPGSYFVFVDGFTIDPFGGPNEGNYVLNVEIESDPPEICDNGIDDDGDVYADCGDPDCTNAPACAGCLGGANPTAEFGIDACTDGIDNDCDGQIDCADSDCSASDYYVTECCNGTDENGNRIPDDFNCRCNSNADCTGEDQICYGNTASTCGIPCTFFFGDVCPFVAPGSRCNETTQQCEF